MDGSFVFFFLFEKIFNTNENVYRPSILQKKHKKNGENSCIYSNTAACPLIYSTFAVISVYETSNVSMDHVLTISFHFAVSVVGDLFDSIPL